MQKHRCCALQKTPLLHTHALHWTMASSSGFRSILDSWGTSWKKTRIWYQHHTLNLKGCCSCISWNFYLLRIQHQGYRKVMYNRRTKGRAVHTHLSWSTCTKTAHDWVCSMSYGKTLTPKSELQFYSWCPHSNVVRNIGKTGQSLNKLLP